MTDLVVVGAGPVGLVTAIAATQRGLSVVVVDRRRPTLDHSGQLALDKACGEGLMSPGLKVLQDLGIEIDSAGSSPILGIRYIDGNTVAEGAFIDGDGLGVRRLFLHQALMRRAESLQIDIRWGCRASALREAGIDTSLGQIDGRYVVGADGLKGRVRQWAGLHRGVSKRHKRYGIRRHFALPPWTDFVEVYWAKVGEAYITPVGPNRVGVAFLCNEQIHKFDDMLQHFPQLAERLAGAPTDSRPMGTGPLWQKTAQVYKNNVALVGDASGYLDAITGEGLSLGFRQALALVDAIQADDLKVYARAHRRLRFIPYLMMAVLLENSRHPWLRSKLVRALAKQPHLWSKMLAVGHGSKHFTYVKPWELLAFGLRILVS